MAPPQPSRKILEIFQPFVDEILADSNIPVHSVHLVGSALTADFIETRSDINSILVLDRLDTAVLDRLIVLGNRYCASRIAAPLVMTPASISSSLDSFPMEFLSFREIHHTVHGPDILARLEIDRNDLRLQCERELKSKLFWLRQDYLRWLGKEEHVREQLIRSMGGCLPLFRGILYLAGGKAEPNQEEILAGLNRLTGVDTTVFASILRCKRGAAGAEGEIAASFTAYCAALEHLMQYVDTFSL